MAIKTVNGTPLQPAIDTALPGDTIVVKAGTYAGRIRVFGKALDFKAEGAVIIDGGQGDGFVNVDIDRAKVTMDGFTYAHGGAALRITGDCTGSVISNFDIPVVDWMVRNTSGGSDDNGGNAFQLTRREGQSGAIGAKGITIRDGKVRKCRAVSFDYGRDGGIFEIYGGVENILIQRVEGWDNVNVFESGKGSGQPDNRTIGVRDCIFHGRPDPSTGATQATVANGMYIRAVDGLLVDHCEFDRIDWWAATFISTGGFAGGIANVSVVDSVFRLMPGVNRMVAAGAAAGILYDRNKVYVTTPTTVVAEVAGKRYLSGDKAALTTATGWEANSTWGAEPPPSTCEDDLVQAQADLAQAQRDLIAANALAAQAGKQRDDALALAAEQRASLDRINALSA